jgi:diacylglycerol kinase (ATP)
MDRRKNELIFKIQSMETQPFSTRARARSFQYAFEGMIKLIQRDHNILIHLFTTIAVIVLSIFIRINKTEALALVFVIGLVWVAELFNTAIEKTMDLISTQHHPQIKFIKDVSAAAVLLAAITAAITGCIIFIPKIILWLA